MSDVNRTDIQSLRDERRTAVFQVRMRPSVKAAGEKAAAADNRSLAALMETLLIEHLRERGFLGHRPTQVAQAPGTPWDDDDASAGLKLPRGEG